MMKILFSVILFSYPFWITNILLNMLWPLKRRFNWIKKIDHPLDGELKINGKRILGESTTYLGWLLSFLIGIFFFASGFDALGLVKSLCTYFGHATGSLIKRRFSIPDGQFTPLIDHGDYIVFGGIILLATGHARADIFLYSLLLTLLFQPLFCFLGHTLKLRDRKL